MPNRTLYPHVTGCCWYCRRCRDARDARSRNSGPWRTRWVVLLPRAIVLRLRWAL